MAICYCNRAGELEVIGRLLPQESLILVIIMDVIHQEVTRLAKTVTGTIGFCVKHIESHQCIDYNASLHFPMTSTFKIPLAAHVLSLVDWSQLALDQMVEVHQGDLCPGSGTIRTL